jgi:hypothetical protein
MQQWWGHECGRSWPYYDQYITHSCNCYYHPVKLRRNLCSCLWSRNEKMRACLQCTCHTPCTSLPVWSPFSERGVPKWGKHRHLILSRYWLKISNKLDTKTARVGCSQERCIDNVFLILRTWTLNMDASCSSETSVPACKFTLSQHGWL